MLRKVLGESQEPAQVKLSEIMSSPIITVSPDAKVAEALEIMAHHGFRRLLVMDDDKPVGIIAQRFTIQEEVEFLRSKAYEPAGDAMRYHPFYKGKMEVSLKVPVRSIDDFAIWYTPGVAEPCKDIQENPLRVFDHTNKGNTIAIVTDGTRVLGLGDIGPEAALPVMEGKALLFRYLGGVDAHPICLNTTDPDQFVETVKAIQPAYGAVNLEDIAQPKCFDILDRLEQEAEIPVWHDDQQGTATVVLAGFLNALKLVSKSIGSVRVALIGAGASNIRTARLMMAAGVDPKRLFVVDSTGILHSGREDLEDRYPQKWEIAQVTNGEVRGLGLALLRRKKSEEWPRIQSCLPAPIQSQRSGPGRPRRQAREWWPPADRISPIKSTIPWVFLGSSVGCSMSAAPASRTKCASQQLKSWRLSLKKREYMPRRSFQRWRIGSYSRESLLQLV
jgi:malate dehydrogenase (oxaloacetate-decarboxylating)